MNGIEERLHLLEIRTRHIEVRLKRWRLLASSLGMALAATYSTGLHPPFEVKAQNTTRFSAPFEITKQIGNRTVTLVRVDGTGPT
jgi:hypothetical protein